MKAAIPPSTFNASLRASGTLLSAFYSYPQLYVTWNTNYPTLTTGINILQITDINGVATNIEFPTATGTPTTTEVIIPLVCRSLFIVQNADGPPA